MEADHTVVVPIVEASRAGAHLQSEEAYKAMYAKSVEDPQAFWGEQARDLLKWDRPFDKVQQGSFQDGDLAWFLGGKLNVSVQCLDRHVETHPDKVAIIWEADEPGHSKSFTYKEVLANTCRVANVMIAHGVRQGDPVTFYMPMVPEIAFAMLACTRLGAPHSVVFAGFSADALRDRIVDVKSKFVFTSNEGKRGGRTMALKKIVDDAIAGIAEVPEAERVVVEKVFVFERTDAAVNMVAGRDVDMKVEVPMYRPYCPPVSMDSEDPLFYLYTSGSTGKPKGVAHTTAGYILYATLTHKYVFDIRPNDIYACVADCGWITGHTYIVYGPLSNGATTLMFESTPLYPDAGRYWDMVQTHKVTQFYTAPTAIRALMRFGTEPTEKYDLSSLRVLGTVGEPINPEAWKWYFENIGKKNCAVVDTYWQTETGGIIMTPLPGCTPMKPGSACRPFFGIVPALLDPHTGKVIPEVAGEERHGVLCIKEPWPSLARTVQGNHERYMNTYLDPYKGYYFTSDGATRDKDGYIWITGRVDDVLNVSGHRLGSAEIESALVAHPHVAEAAAIGFPHDVKGEGIACYVITRNGVVETLELLAELKLAVRSGVGPLATPDFIIITPELPKTRSGKIMRRLLRKVISKAPSSEFGDVSTLADSTIVEVLVAKVAVARP